MFGRYGILVALIAALMGCALLEVVDRHPGAARLAVQYAVNKVVDDRHDRAERVREIAVEVRSALAGEVAGSVSELRSFVESRIRWGRLDAADTLLIDSLLDEIQAELEYRLGDGILAPEDRLRVDQVVSWIESAATAISG